MLKDFFGPKEVKISVKELQILRIAATEKGRKRKEAQRDYKMIKLEQLRQSLKGH